ncbi:hypothetical protein ACOSQ3_006761 [Xanthoceras sorbifolium]
MGRLNVMRCPVAKRGANASHFALVSGGPPPFLLPPPLASSVKNHRKGNEVAFDAATKQPRAPTLYEEFLTSGLSQRIKQDKGMDLRHTLLRHTIIFASLAYKDMLDAKRNEAERRELCNELMKAKKELAAKTRRKK